MVNSGTFGFTAKSDWIHNLGVAVMLICIPNSHFVSQSTQMQPHCITNTGKCYIGELKEGSRNGEGVEYIKVGIE